MWVDALEDHHSIRILIYLLSKGKVVKTKIYDEASNSSNTAQKRIAKMVGAGLLIESEEEFPPKRKWIELTPKGRKVARLLLEVESALR